MSEARLDMSKDDALMELYRRLQERGAPEPGSFTALDQAGRREYFRQSRRRSRASDRSAKDAGNPAPTVGNVRDALADAALMILATGAPGVDQVRIVLGSVFSKRPGAPVSIEQRARSGRLRTKMVQP
jgi:hypothetical protein